MAPSAQLDSDFAFGALPPVQPSSGAAADDETAMAADVQTAVTAQTADPLGPLSALPGTWKGKGFNAIWRPHHPGQDRFLELNLTNETIVFSKINGAIPNRGLQMHDINMHGITYMQQISEASGGTGLHVEPGIWATVPATSDPNEPSTVVRMASIPHGTTILAQGITEFHQGGPQNIPNNNILPFPIGGGAPIQFAELNLSQSSPFRFASPGVTQAMVNNPNGVLQSVIQGKPMKNRTFIQVSTKHQPIAGGGTANTAFLAAGSLGGNAKAVEVDATFWIETLPGGQGNPDQLQLQYTQLVLLNFNGLSWPHVTVATLQKQ